MKLKPSNYNIVIDELEQDKKLLFNSYTCAYGIADKKAQETLKNIQTIAFESLSDEDKDQIETMKKMGFLVLDDGIDEWDLLQLEQHRQRYAGKHLALTIAPTLDCNMACPYCYEERQNAAMSQEVQNSIVELAKNKIKENKIKSIYVSWYGGEPTLELDTIVNLSKQLITLCEENDVTYFSDIVTNGYLLDAKMAEMLKECKVSRAQITVDGLKETHNARRILRSGEKSFDTIIKNIDEIKDFLTVNIRVNVDMHNVTQIDELSKFFLQDKGWKENPSFYLAPVESLTENCKANGSECYTSSEFLLMHTNSIRKIYEAGNHNIAKWIYPHPRAVGCSGIGYGYFVIDPNGKLYSCWSDIGNEEKSTGTLLPNGEVSETREYLRWLTLETPEKCKACKLLPICQSGCPYKRMQNQNNPTCSHQTLSYKANLKLAYELYLQEKQQVI